MALKNIPTIDELAKTTGQSKEQLRKDRDAVPPYFVLTLLLAYGLTCWE